MGLDNDLITDNGQDDLFLHLNVSGRRYTMTKAAATEIRGSLFATLATQGHSQPLSVKGVHYRRHLDEFFVERSPLMFDIVLHYAYTGHVNRPAFVCVKSLEEELSFWGLEYPGALAPCCAGPVMAPASNGAPVRDVMRRRTGMRRNVSSFIRRPGGSKVGQKLDELWRFCEDPESSRKALLFNIICILSILVSIANLVIGTVPRFQNCQDTMSFLPLSFTSVGFSVSEPTVSNYTTGPSATPTLQPGENASSTESVTTPRVRLQKKFSQSCDGGYIFDLIEMVCIVWFTTELTLRYVSCPDKWSFVKSPLNIIDFLATFPFYIEILIWGCGLITDLNRVSSVSSVLLMLRVMRVLRAFRVLRLARYFDSLQLMGETLWESRRDMGLLALFLAVGVLIFSTILFYVEKDVEGTAYSSIPAAFWWAIVTLTTTGYGDVTPQTTTGKIVAGVACIAGVLILAFPVSILVEHFRLSYAHRRRNAMTEGTFTPRIPIPLPVPSVIEITRAQPVNAGENGGLQNNSLSDVPADRDQLL